MKDFKNVKVLLTEGRARQVMPLMKSLKKLGCHITTLNSSRLDMGYSSRFPNRKLLGYCNPVDPERTYQTILDAVTADKYDLLIPLNDYVAIILSRHKDEIEQYVKVAVNPWNVFEFASDKLKTMTVCQEKHIPCPQTCLTEDDVFKRKHHFPMVVKPRTGYGAVGFHVVNSQEELETVYSATAQKFGPPLVQEYIPQTAYQYKTELYIDRDGNVKSAVVFAKIRWYPIDGGSSTLNKTVDRPDIIKSCIALLKAIGWRGYADIDLIDDPRDNTAKIMEINPRITGSVKICYAAGVNFSQQILEDFCGLPVTPFMEYQKDIYLRYLHTDLLWFLKSPDRFHANPSWFNFLHSTDQIFYPDDPLPFLTYSLAAIGKLLQDKSNRSLN